MRTMLIVIVVCFVFAGSVATRQPSATAAQASTEHLRVILRKTSP